MSQFLICHNLRVFLPNLYPQVSEFTKKKNPKSDDSSSFFTLSFHLQHWSSAKHANPVSVAQWFWAQFGPILVKTKCHMFPSKCFLFGLTWCFYWQITHLWCICTPKATVMPAFTNIIFCQTGVKSHHPIGIKTSDGGYFFFWVCLHEK